MPTNLDKLTELFGGHNKFAAAICADASMVSRWRKPRSEGGRDGHIPPRYNRAVMTAGAALVAGMPESEALKFRDAIMACLDPSVCPTCGGPIDDFAVS